MEGRARLELQVDGRPGIRGASELERELRQLKSQASSVERELQQLGRGGRSAGDGMSEGARGTKAFASGLGSLRGAIAGLGLAALAREAAQFADSASKISSQLRLATKDAGSFAQAQSDTRRIAVQTRSDLEATATLYATMSRNAASLGATQAEVSRATETVTKAFKISGASQSEAAGATRQLSQALASGVLRGDEFNSVMENAPRLAKLLADSLGVPIGALRQMAQDGELTSDKLFRALNDRKFTQGLDDEFKQIPATFGDAMNAITNVATITFGAFDRGGEFSQSLFEFADVGEESMKRISDSAFAEGANIRAAFAGLRGVFLPLIDEAQFVWNKIKSLGGSFNPGDMVQNTFREIDGITNAVVRPDSIVGRAFGRSNLEQRYVKARDAERNRIAGEQRDAYLADNFPLRPKAASAAEALAGGSGGGGGGKKGKGGKSKGVSEAAREAAKELRDLQNDLKSVTTQFDPAAAAANKYADNLDKIAKLKSKGKISDGDAALYGVAAGKDYQESETKRIRSETQDFYKNLGIDVQSDFDEVVNTSVNRWENGLSEGAKRMGTILEDQTVTAAQAFAQVIGGKLGGVVQQLLGVVEGMNTGNFNSVGGRAGGLLTLLGGKGSKDANGNPTGFLGGYGQFGKDIKKTFTDIFGGEKGLFSGALGKTLGKAFAGAQFGGAIGNGITKALGIKGSKTGGQIGGAIGGAFGGPLGSVIGGTLGSVVGGLFKKAKTSTATLNFSGGELGFSAGGNSQKFAEQAKGSAKGVISGLQSIAEQLGGTITGAGSVSIGLRDGKYFVDPTGRGNTKAKKGAIAFGEDEAAAIKFAIVDAVKDGAITGLREGTKRLLTGGSDLDAQMSKALRFENVFRELKQRTDPVGAAIGDLNKEFEGLKRVFADAGASAAEYADLQKLYEMKRVDIIEQANNQMLGSMRDYLNNLRGGSDSPFAPQTRLANTRAELDRLDALRAGGNKVDFETYRTAADAFLSASRDFNGSSMSYFGDFQRVTSTVEQLLTAQQDKANQQLASIDFSGVIGALDNQTNVTTALLTQINANLQAALAGGGGAAEASGIAAGGSSGFRYLERYYKAY